MSIGWVILMVSVLALASCSSLQYQNEHYSNTAKQVGTVTENTSWTLGGGLFVPGSVSYSRVVTKDIYAK